MSREIKFRVWDADNNCMYENIGIGQISQYDYQGDRITEQEGLEIMQYTGLKDRNGKEIYEGDILHVFEVSNNRSLEYESKVEFIESGFLVTQPDECQVPLACFHNLDKTYPLFEIEVIGNVYEKE